jgi:hypothetical protein
VGYEVFNETGGHMQLLHREWEMLLELATRQGWRPAPSRYYAEGGRVFEVEARHLTAALKRALPDIPGFYADDLAGEERGATARTLPQMLEEGGVLHERPGDEQGDPFAYFSGGNRRTLEQFVGIAAEGFEIRPLPGFGGEF